MRNYNKIFWGRIRLLSSLLGGFLFLAASLSQAQEWEMRICADPNNLPYSNQEEEGFDNQIAQIIAQELEAKLTYDWWLHSPRTVNEKLREGECDLIMGVAEGYMGLLTTIPYYRSIYTFIYLEDSPHEVYSFDDPVLRELRIAVETAGVPPYQALVTRGLSDNVVQAFPYESHYAEHGIYNRHEPVVEAVASGEVDVAIAWGPIAGYFAKQQSVPLKVVPVTPEFDPPFLSMVYSFTIGVRQGDEALRDRLNVALARRWDEIQEVLKDYGVPLLPLPKPVVEIGGR